MAGNGREQGRSDRVGAGRVAAVGVALWAALPAMSQRQ